VNGGKMSKTYIYGLVDPRDQRIYYVGKSNWPSLRLRTHIADTDSNKWKAEWIGGLLTEDLEPELKILEKVNLSEWQKAERRWIKHGLDNDWPLTNIQAGGSGLTASCDRILYDFTDVFALYANENEVKNFDGLERYQKVEILRQMAIAMMDKSHFAIRKRGGNPKLEFSERDQYFAGVNKASELIKQYL
jgi:hypothetical protein